MPYFPKNSWPAKTRTDWRKFLPALVLSIAISNSPVVALGAGVLAERGQVFLVVFAVLGIFGLAFLTRWLQRRAAAPKE